MTKNLGRLKSLILESIDVADQLRIQKEIIHICGEQINSAENATTRFLRLELLLEHYLVGIESRISRLDSKLRAAYTCLVQDEEE